MDSFRNGSGKHHSEKLMNLDLTSVVGHKNEKVSNTLQCSGKIYTVNNDNFVKFDIFTEKYGKFDVGV